MVVDTELAPPVQAVILAGGRGTRLKHLTADKPKPMVPFHGQPFLTYLLDMLKEQGITKVLLLLGYRAQNVIDHFGDGRSMGLDIQYSVSDVDHDTGERLRVATPLVDDHFLLMYCDNYWPMDYAQMWASYRSKGCLAQVTVYANDDGFTRDNLIVSDAGRVVTYDKSRTTPNLKGVDIGFILTHKSILDRIPAGNVSFEASVYPGLVEDGELTAFVTGHRYYSVGNVERLPITETFLAREPAVIFDRDGVLNKRMPRGEYVRSWAEWSWLPGAKETLARLSQQNIRIIVVTNQAGIARGAMSQADLDDIHDHMRADVSALGGHIDAIYYCPHGWDEGCECRKPKPGMLFQAQRGFHLDLSRTWFLGDDERDREAASAAGSRFAMVSADRSAQMIMDEIFPPSH